MLPNSISTTRSGSESNGSRTDWLTARRGFSGGAYMPRRIGVLAILPLVATALQAQEFRSTLSGRVVDPTGAAIPNASLTAINTGTNAKSETRSGNDGLYTIPFLVPGTYQIVAEAPGFKRYIREQFQISTNERVSLDIHMDLGSSREAITVTAESPLLTTATASTGQVIDSQQVENMPLNGRTPLVLAQLAFGVVPNSDPKFNRPFDNSGPSAFSLGGARSQSNELLLNGIPDMTRDRRVAYNPPVDAVSEVKVEVFQADAAYGDTGGGTVTVTLRGGGNTFHGSLYEFNQVSALTATPFFTNKAGLIKPVTRFNQWGGTVGGPVWIPKLINGRNKLFFFFASEGIQDSFPEPLTTTVPTQAERHGDFSALLASGPNYQLYDPSTGVLQSGKVSRQPLANNVIPTERLNPVALSYLKYFPLPNQPGGPDGANNYLANSVRSDIFASYLGHLDYNLSEKNHLSLYGYNNGRVENRGNRFNNIATGNFLSRINWGGSIDDVYSFTPTLFLDTRFGWTRFIEGNSKPSNGFDPTTLGFPPYIAQNSSKLVLPIVSFSDGFNQLGDVGGDTTPFDTFQIFSTVTKMLSSHNLKFGADLRLIRESSNSYGNSTGNYSFDSTWMRQNSTATGQPLGGAFAAFLLGLPTGGGYDINAQRTNQSKYMAFFIQDDWRVSSTLNVNLGIRYEHELPTTERYNRALLGFDPTAVNAVIQPAETAYAKHPISQISPADFHPFGGVLFAGNPYRNLYNTATLAFSPRFGISWAPKALQNRTVLRAGTGIFYSTYGTTGVNQPGFSQNTSFVATQNSFLMPYSTLSNPFPTGILQPPGASLGINTNLGKSVTFENPNLKQPYAIRWDLDIQHQLGKNVVVELGYVGNHSVHLTNNYGLNPLTLQYFSRLPYRDNVVINELGAVVTNPFAGLLPGTGLNGSTTSVGSLLRPFPEFSGDSGVQMSDFNSGSSYFHMFVAGIRKRYSSGLQLLANYSHSRLMERNSRLNLADPTNEKRVSADDRPDRFVVSASYALPFGRGKEFLNHASRLTDLMIGGWTLNGIYTYQTGAPLEWGNVIYFGGDIDLNSHNVDHSFDTTRFNTNSTQQLSDNVRTFPSHFSNLRQDGANNIDLSVIKDFRLFERVTLQYRLEAFNAFNRPEFSAPDLAPTSTTFGQITNQNNLARILQMALRLRF